MSLSISSPAFQPGGAIPVLYTCQGADVSPPLTFSGVPPGAGSLALICDDPDAPDPEAPERTWIHWLLYNLPADCSGLVEGVSEEALPRGTLQGVNSWHRVGYGGPCPPIGRHRYFFKLFALDVALPDLRLPESDALAAAIEPHLLARAEVIGTYRKT